MNPIVIALAVVLTFGFEAMLYGVEEFSPGIFPSIESRTPQVDTSACGGEGFVDATICLAATVAQVGANIIGFFVWIASVVGYVVLWFANLATLNVRDAHWLGRIMMGTMIAGSIGWTMASYIRGVKP